MTDLSHLSKEAKEAYVSIKMEEIRRKNEELKKRHAEIEADKRNAEMNSSKAQSTQVKRVTQGIPPEKPVVVGRVSSGRGKRLENLAKEQLKAPEYQQKKQQQRLNEDENPPPDPVFNFLYDRSREGKDTEDRYQRSRRHISNFGGQDFANVKNTMQIRKTQEKDNPPGPPRNKMEMALRMTGRERKEYENWRLEREKIEEDRLARQKTATGEWRREWDKNKLEQDDVEEQQRPQWQPRGRGRGGGGGRGHSFRGRGDHGHHPDMSRPPRWRGRGQGQGQGRGGGGSHYGARRQSSSSQSESERSITTEEVLPVEKDVDVDRTVQVGEHSLRISISNDMVAGQVGAEKPPPTPRSAVTPPRRIGSGRVLSTSSQSEDERGDSRSQRRGKPYQRGQFARERGSRPPSHGGSQRGSGKSGRYQRPRRDESEEIVRPQALQEPSKPVSNVESKPMPVEKLEDATASSGTSESKDEWETGGDESWEDVTTSGNESLELSGPSDDVHTIVINAEDDGDDDDDDEDDDDDDDDDDDVLGNTEGQLTTLPVCNLKTNIQKSDVQSQHDAKNKESVEAAVDISSSTALQDAIVPDCQVSDALAEDKDVTKQKTTVDELLATNSCVDINPLEMSIPDESFSMKTDDDDASTCVNKEDKGDSSVADQILPDVPFIPTDDDTQLTSDTCTDSSSKLKEQTTDTQFTKTDAPCKSNSASLSLGTGTGASCELVKEISDVQTAESVNFEVKRPQDSITSADKVELSSEVKQIINQDAMCETADHQEIKDCSTSLPADTIAQTETISSTNNAITSHADIAKMEEQPAEEVSCLAEVNHHDVKKVDVNLEQNNDAMPGKIAA